MNIGLWVVQILLAAIFLLAGALKTVRPIDWLATRMTWVKVVPGPLVRFIGFAEFLGGLGLLLPALTGVLPWLTPLAAVGLAVVMLLAAIFHLFRREVAILPGSVVLGILAAFAAYGRFVLVPF